MAYTVQQAKAAVQKLIDSDSVTEENLKYIINKLDINSKGSITVLYTSPPSGTVDRLGKNPNIRILDKTEASKFLSGLYDGSNVEMLEALRILYKEEPDLSISGAGINKANIFVSGIDGEPRTPGAWDMISRNFVRQTEGEVILLAGKRDCRNNTVKPINNIAFKKEEVA